MIQYKDTAYVQPKGTPYSVSFRQFPKNSILTRPDQRLLVIRDRRTKEEKNLFLVWNVSLVTHLTTVNYTVSQFQN